MKRRSEIHTIPHYTTLYTHTIHTIHTYYTTLYNLYIGVYYENISEKSHFAQKTTMLPYTKDTSHTHTAKASKLAKLSPNMNSTSSYGMTL